MYSTSSITHRCDGKTYRLALLNVRLGQNLGPVAHSPSVDGASKCCGSCLAHAILAEKVLNKGEKRIKDRAQFYDGSLYQDFAVELAKTGIDMPYALGVAMYYIPLLTNHLRPREYRFVWLAEDRSRVVNMQMKDLLRINREMAAHAIIDPFWREPLLLPDGVLHRRARATTVDWGESVKEVLEDFRAPEADAA